MKMQRPTTSYIHYLRCGHTTHVRGATAPPSCSSSGPCAPPPVTPKAALLPLADAPHYGWCCCCSCRLFLAQGGAKAAGLSERRLRGCLLLCFLSVNLLVGRIISIQRWHSRCLNDMTCRPLTYDHIYIQEHFTYAIKDACPPLAPNATANANRRRRRRRVE